jgi:SAM-dependent methyltransferase
MCNQACIDFGRDNLKREDIAGKKVIEIGARDVNGSLRPFVESLDPETYVGVDLEEGPGVDVICNVYDLVTKFGEKSFDVVISSEMVEHVQDWRRAFSQIKSILAPGGVVLITTRSIGFPYHDYPFDYWRYELKDMRAIFSDMKIEALEPDEISPGVLVTARKPVDFLENDLSAHALYSMVTLVRTAATEFSSYEYFLMRCRNSFLAQKLSGLSRRVSGSPAGG